MSDAVWLFGCGNMGGAMLNGWLADGMDPARITVVDPYLATAPEGVRLLTNPPAGEDAPALLLLAIKPQVLETLSPIIAPLLGKKTLLVSILAGAEIETLRKHFPAPKAIVRVMPNMPASIGKGVSALYADGLNSAQREETARLMTPLGAVEWIDDEALFHAVIAVSGSGPAFVFRFIEALARTGAELGLAPETALKLAIATVEGSAALAGASAESPAQLAERVRSPNGTTHAGLVAMDEDGAFFALIDKVLRATAARSAEMAEEARG